MLAAISRIVSFALVGCLLACGAPEAKDDFNIFSSDDDRYDLLAHNMPPILIEDARECTSLMNKSSLFKYTISGPERIGFDRALVFWKQVDKRFLKQTKQKSGFLIGGVATDFSDIDVPSLYPDGSDVEIKAEKCGEYGGNALVPIGISTLKESVELAELVQPGIFEDMGFDYQQVLDGVERINSQAASVSLTSISDRISCSAIFYAFATTDAQYEPYANIWTAALNQDVEAQRLDASNIAEQSDFWQALKKGGADGVAEVQGYDEMAELCVKAIDEAIELHNKVSE